jgi:hypothetical protein
LFSAVSFALNEFWVPDTEAAQTEIMNRHSASAASSANHSPHRVAGFFSHPRIETQSSLGFHNTRDGHNWIIGSYNFATDVMTDPQVYWNDHGTNYHLVAKRAERVNDVWTFYDATTFFASERLITNKVALPQFSETPREFANEAKFASRFQGKLSAAAAEIPIVEILDY